MRATIVYFLVLFLSGLPGVASSVNAALSDQAPPLLRHIPPSPPAAGGVLVIQTIVEDERDIAEVILWHRLSGRRGYQKVVMVRTSGNTYEGRIELSEKDRSGIEYYIEAVDRSGNRGKDGSETKPYFVSVREERPLPALSSRSAEAEEKRPLWKRPWFWLAILAVGGGIAAATAGGKEGEDKGTIIVD